MNTRGLLNYIENVRYGRNITQEEFLDGIVSRRQYQRYRNGESYVPLDIVEQLASRLGISSRKLMLEFEKEEYQQSEIIKKYYNLVVSRHLDEADLLEKEIKKFTIIDEEREFDYNSAVVLKQFYKGLISVTELVSLQRELVGYPEILKSDIITDGEAQVLGIIQEFSKEEREPVIEKLESTLINDEFQITGGNFLSKLQTMFYIIKYYGRKNELEKVVYYCELGIDACDRNKSYYILAHFSYYLALAKHRLGMQDEIEEPLRICVMTLLLENDLNKIEKFKSYFEKDLDINFDKFLSEIKVGDQ